MFLLKHHSFFSSAAVIRFVVVVDFDFCGFVGLLVRLAVGASVLAAAQVSFSNLVPVGGNVIPQLGGKFFGT